MKMRDRLSLSNPHFNVPRVPGARGREMLRRSRARGVRAFLLLVFIIVCGAETAYATLSVTPNTFNVIGLDSNNVNTGPDVFPSGVLVCNTGGTTVNNIVGTFIWDSSNAFINLTGLNPVTFNTLAPGACTNLFFNVQVTRSSSAYNQARRFHIEVTAVGEPVYSTPTPREIYVEKLVSQNRNTTLSVTGPSTVIIGQTYDFVVNAKTATGGYEQLESFLSFSNTMFQVISIATTYTAPAGGTNNKVYADACGWENNPLSPNYRNCVGPVNYPGGKAGGDIRTTYTVRILSGGSASLSSTIYDFSGSSYHYGSNFGSNTMTITALAPPNVPLVKSVAPNGTQPPGTDLVYTINFTNTGGMAAQQFILTDPVPANTDFKVGSVTTALGSFGSVTIEYSTDGSTWSPALPPAAGTEPPGYNRNVRHVRWRFTGTLAPNSSGSVSFTVRIR